jgi:hypothetical protein
LKKVLAWFGGIVLALIVFQGLLTTYAFCGKPIWDERSEQHARTVVNNFSEMSEEQFNKYWGDEPPGTQKQREMLIEWAGSLGTLETIDKVERVGYMQKVTFRGIYRYYTYDVYATYSESPLRFRLWFHIHGNKLDVQNMNVFPEAVE